MPRTGIVIAGLAALGMLAGCGDKAGGGNAAQTATPTAKTYDKVELLAAASGKAAKEKQTAKVALDMGQRGGGTCSSRAVSDTDYGASCEFAMSEGGKQEQMKFVLLPDAMYLNLPESQREAGMKPWLKLDLKDRNNPVAQALGQIGTQVQDSLDIAKSLPPGSTITETSKETLDGKETTRYTITVDTKAAAAAAKNDIDRQKFDLMAKNGMSTFTVKMWVDSEDLPAKSEVNMTVPQVGPVTVTARFSEWGQPVDIKAPPASEVGEFPKLGGN